MNTVSFANAKGFVDAASEEELAQMELAITERRAELARRRGAFLERQQHQRGNPNLLKIADQTPSFLHIYHNT